MDAGLAHGLSSLESPKPCPFGTRRVCGTWAIATSSEVEKIAIYMITRAGKTEGNSVQIKLACEEDQLYSEEYYATCRWGYYQPPKRLRGP